jgi:hypothetical protein
MGDPLPAGMIADGVSVIGQRAFDAALLLLVTPLPITTLERAVQSLAKKGGRGR